LIKDRIEDIERRGHAEVVLAGRSFTITKQFLDDLERQQGLIGKLRRALIIFHSPTDAIVGIESARRIYDSAKHPKNFVSLDGADHLLSNRKDADYVGAILAAWASRYLSAGDGDDLTAQPHGQVIVRDTGEGKFQQAMRLGPHFFLADEPTAHGGDDTGPTPYELLLAALGSCTAMTLRLYADRKGWPLERTTVHLAHDKRHAEDCEGCEHSGAKIDHIDREIALEGELSSEQRERLIEIASKCPVHRTLHSEVQIDTRQRRR
jgi:putative redox protein